MDFSAGKKGIRFVIDIVEKKHVGKKEGDGSELSTMRSVGSLGGPLSQDKRYGKNNHDNNQDHDHHEEPGRVIRGSGGSGGGHR